MAIALLLFQDFLQLHADLDPVGESNSAMQNSYIVLDEQLCVLDSSSGSKVSAWTNQSSKESTVFDVGIMIRIKIDAEGESNMIRPYSIQGDAGVRAAGRRGRGAFAGRLRTGSGTRFNKQLFGLNFCLKNGLSFGLRFHTLIKS